MSNRNRKIILRVTLYSLAVGFLVKLLYDYFLSIPIDTEDNLIRTELEEISKPNASNQYNLWLTFAKADNRLQLKFRYLLVNLANVSSIPLSLHVIVDGASRSVADEEIRKVVKRTNKFVDFTFYDIMECKSAIQDIVGILSPHFSSKQGTYFSDALFFISTGLHRIAPENQELAVMIDCDVIFKEDINNLFEEFKNFKSANLFGLAPELSPVYRHVLSSYRKKHKNTKFGGYHPLGFQGYNSGVVLFNLSAIRTSEFYKKEILTNETIDFLIEKYMFQGHLGDQDFYTLLGFEYPELIYNMDCSFNRQLCTWWRNDENRDIFDLYFLCDRKKIYVLHGNCNTNPHLLT